MILSTEKSTKKIVFFDWVFNCATRISCLLLVSCFFFFFSVIFLKGLRGFWSYGFSRIFLHLDFNLNSSSSNVSFWSPLFITLLLAIGVVLICIPFAVKASIWIAFYARRGVASFLNFLIELFSVFPSIIFGLFFRNYISTFLKNVFGFDNTPNILMAIITLLFMTLPLIINLLVSSLKQQKDIVSASVALGVSKNQSIYKIAFPNIKNSLIIATTIIFNKVISESVALTFLLSNENYSDVFQNGFFSIFGSKLNPIAPLISENFFSDGAGLDGQNLLFTFGFLLLLFSLCVNNCILRFAKSDRPKESSRWRLFVTWLGEIVDYKREKLTRLFFFNKRNFQGKYVCLDDYIIKRFKKNTWKNIRSCWIKIWELLCIWIILLFITSIIACIVIGASIGLFFSGTAPSAGPNTLLRAVINSFVIIIIALSIALPIALLSAIYLSEFCKDKDAKKWILSMINTACAAPSIVYGIFGLSFFLDTLGLSSSGSSGKSLLAGILTLVLFISCHLVKIFYVYFDKIPQANKDAAYALGVGKFTTFSKVVIPLVKEDLISAVLINVGKMLGETAPLYLTAGLSSVSITHIMYPGQTLTTRIYAQLFEANLAIASKNMFESAFILMIFMFCLMFLLRVVIPFIYVGLQYGMVLYMKYCWCKIKYHFALLHWFIFIKYKKQNAHWLHT